MADHSLSGILSFTVGWILIWTVITIIWVGAIYFFMEWNYAEKEDRKFRHLIISASFASLFYILLAVLQRYA
jgi:hypothetical protein